MKRKHVYEMDVHKYIITQPKPVIKPFTFNSNRSVRYCECCKSHQPRTSNKMTKGWKCDKCKKGESDVSSNSDSIES